MNLPEFPSAAGGTSSPPGKKELQLQGTRPPSLRVSKDSHKIRKPSLPEQRKSVIIYTVSPKVLHVTVSDFMNIVQHLTGPSFGEEPNIRAGGETRVDRENEPVGEGERSQRRQRRDVDVRRSGSRAIPRNIVAATLPPISPEFFSKPQTMCFWNDLSPFWSSNSFIASPSGHFLGNVVSPLPSPDIFNLFD